MVTDILWLRLGLIQKALYVNFPILDGYLIPVLLTMKCQWSSLNTTGICWLFYLVNDLNLFVDYSYYDMYKWVNTV